jgi:hypothetical protein
MKGFTTHAKEE